MALPREGSEPQAINDLAGNLGDLPGIVLQSVSPAAPKLRITNLVAQLSTHWRIVIVSPGAGRRTASWSLQHLSPDGAWQGKGLARTSEALRALVKAHAGPVVDPLGIAVIEALPLRIDVPPRGSAAPRRREPRT